MASLQFISTYGIAHLYDIRGRKIHQRKPVIQTVEEYEAVTSGRMALDPWDTILRIHAILSTMRRIQAVINAQGSYKR